MKNILKKVVVLMLMLAFITPVFSDEDASVTELKALLKEFEKAVKYEFQDRGWRGKRNAWIESVDAADSPQAFGAVLIQLETSTTWSSVQASWRQRRAGWLEEVRAATTVPQMAGLLFELEKITKWEATYDSWRRNRANWVQRVQALIGS